jgi:archaellum component FlaC
MENNAELIRLEEFVDKLLNKYNTLKADYLNLQDTLRDRDNECAELKANIENLTSERTEVGSRVAGLLDRIEQWEGEHDELPEGNEDQGGLQSALFEESENHQ